MSPLSPLLKMVLPKGRLQEKIVELLERTGVRLTFSSRSYRPVCADPTIEIKVLKPQNIASLVALGRHDCGFTGYDWLAEQNLTDGKNLVELLDLGFNPVRIIAAIPESLAQAGYPPERPLIVASEYENLAADYIRQKSLNATLIKAYGATEALPPEDADLIIDNTSTGSTLEMNRLVIVDELLRSTTRFIASQEALADPWKREKLQQLQMLFESTLNAREKVLLEMNVAAENFKNLVAEIPSMKSPTVAPLFNEAGYAVKVAVSAQEVPSLIPKLVALGARDILEYRLEKIVP